MAGPKGSLRQPKSLKLEGVLYRSASVNITRVWLVLRDIECVVSRSIPEFFQSLKNILSVLVPGPV